MNINSYYPVICVKNVQESADFYQKYFDFKLVFQNDWYIHLTKENQPEFNLAFVSRDHPSVPAIMRKSAQGILLNFEYDNVDELYKRSKAEGHRILLDLRDEPWGQRHFILRDPAGVMVDVIKIIEPSQEFLQNYKI